MKQPGPKPSIWADKRGEDMPPKIVYSVQFKFAATFAALIAGLLIIMNTYPIIQFRDLVFSSKKASLQNQATTMISSLASLEALTPDVVRQVMEILDVEPLSRIIITDNSGLILYDTKLVAPELGKYALFSEIGLALGGNLVWYSRLSEGAFMSRVAAPIRSQGATIGCVYLYERDQEQAELMYGIQTNLRSLSLAISMFAVVIIVIFTRALTSRIMELSKALRRVRDGDYSYRTDIRGRDELTELGEEFNLLTDRLEQTEQARRQFVSDASHELKTPLASIRLLSDSILQSRDMDSETMRDFVSDIGNESERLSRTTEKLLSLTRLDQDETISRVPVSIGRVILSTLRLLEPLASKHEVRLSYEISEDCVILAVEDDIYQIIFNLVENGIKYNNPGGSVKLGLYRDNDKVILNIEDTGIGIPEEDMPHIFRRFYRVDKARSSEAGGSGLGLSIVETAVRVHGGELTVFPIDGGGTVFSISFPFYDGVVKQ
jgi:signal transduction histidine kinase